VTALEAQPELATPAPAPRPASLTWLPPLDGLRAVAALAVVATHVSFRSGLTTSGSTVGAFMARLEVGVALFFVLSGYLLYRPFAAAAINGRKSPSSMKYLWKRSLRVLPAYWVMIGTVLAAFSWEYMNDAWDWLVPFGLLQIYQPLRLPIAGEQTWSLATEVSFYLLLPVFALVARSLRGKTPAQRVRRQLSFTGVLIVTGIAWTVCVHAPWWPLELLSSMWLPGYLDWFGVGMALAILTTRTDAVTRFQTTISALASAPWSCWAVAGSLMWIASTPIAGPLAVYPAPTSGESILKHVLYVAVAVFLILPLVGDEQPPVAVQAVLANPVSRFLGKISFGIFLWHLAVIEVWLRVSDTPEFSGEFWTISAVTLAGTIAVASVSYYLIEQPFQRLRR
jgi:peptidoglycan/LPS O-acetylase OafA/YrhL